MSRYRLLPTPAQEAVLRDHCAHARYIWNLAVEQHAHWRPGRKWVRFRWSRQVPPGVKSYRVTLDRSGRWHVAFAAVPEPVPAPGNGQVAGIDRGVTVSAALSTGEMLSVPGFSPARQRRVRRLQRKMARAKRGSARRARVKLAIAKLKARQADVRKDWAEKTTTDLARRFDTIRVEQLDVRAMTRSARGTLERPGIRVAQKRGLNRAIRHQAWGQLVVRLDHKAAGRLERVPAAPRLPGERELVAGGAHAPGDPRVE